MIKKKQNMPESSTIHGSQMISTISQGKKNGHLPRPKQLSCILRRVDTVACELHLSGDDALGKWMLTKVELGIYIIIYV
jgi:hypothetical protein